MENRKQEVKPSMAETQGAQPDSSERRRKFNKFITIFGELTNLGYQACGAPPNLRVCRRLATR